jgi:hypothetical protein
LVFVIGPEAGGDAIRAGDDEGVAGFRIGPAVMDARVAAKTDLSRHMVMVTLRDADERDLITWYEFSEVGLPGRAGHSAQRAFLRIKCRPGLVIDMSGYYPCCPHEDGCRNAMEILAEQYDMRITYVCEMMGSVSEFERTGVRKRLARGRGREGAGRGGVAG